MDGFLTELYRQYFISIDKEKRHRSIHDFDGENSQIRNDEKIQSAMETTALMKDLITKYTSMSTDA
jgi:hypothetical protein